MLASLLPSCALALPEDANQEVTADYTSLDLFIDQGLFVYTGSPDQPTCINQGTLQICGAEIRVEQTEDGGLKKVTATGSPARYQQQPTVDQELVHLSGETLVFDNLAQLLTADENAEFSQAGNVLTHQHIEYNITTGHAAANGSTGERGSMVLPPAVPGN
jgi:lipopolysaccharide export system protein LptA